MNYEWYNKIELEQKKILKKRNIIISDWEHCMVIYILFAEHMILVPNVDS